MAASGLDELSRVAKKLATAAGALVHEGLTRRRVLVETKSTTTDFVTEMDRAAEALIVGGLRLERPHDAVVGEEGAESTGSTGVRWFIDPIDGTTNYVYGLPGFEIGRAHV